MPCRVIMFSAIVLESGVMLMNDAMTIAGLIIDFAGLIVAIITVILDKR